MINRMILQGRMVETPELKTTQNGISVTSFRVAWSNKYKEIENKCFLRCTAWRGTAEFVCKYFVKGQECAVEGELHTVEYTDKDGNKRSNLELANATVHFCGPKQDAAAPSAPYASSADNSPKFEPVDSDDGLPF